MNNKEVRNKNGKWQMTVVVIHCVSGQTCVRCFLIKLNGVKSISIHGTHKFKFLIFSPKQLRV